MLGIEEKEKRAMGHFRHREVQIEQKKSQIKQRVKDLIFLLVQSGPLHD
jgi:hypothetical protein